MTTEEIRLETERINSMDCECAHIAEDAMCVDVLRAIA